MASWLIKLWLKLNGWKTVVGYVLIQLEWFSGNPALVEAIQNTISNIDPGTPEGAKAWANLIIQLILLTGVAHIVKKNVQYGTKRVGQY